MSDNDEPEKPKFRMSVPTDRVQSATMETLLQIRASVDALVVMFFNSLAQSESESVELAERYNKIKNEFLLEYAFELQDTPPEQPGGTEARK